MNGRVVITGAGGFLGSSLCEGLVAAGAEVIGVDNFTVGSATNLKAVAQQVRIVEWNITSPPPAGLFDGVTCIFHLAAIANPRVCAADFPLSYHVNVEGTRIVLDACPPNARVIFLSGAMVYGNPLYLPVDELHPTLGRDPYALTKIMGESLCWAQAPRRNLRTTVVRNFSTYGPRQSVDYLIPKLVVQGLQEERIEIWTGRPSRDFVFVEDAVDALMGIAQSESLAGEVVNLGGGMETHVGDVAKTVAALLGGIPVVDLHQSVLGGQRQVCDNRKLRAATGWSPQVSLQEGVQRVIEARHRSHPIEVTR